MLLSQLDLAHEIDELAEGHNVVHLSAAYIVEYEVSEHGVLQASVPLCHAVRERILGST